MRCVAYSVAERYDLKKLTASLVRRKITFNSFKEVLHLPKYKDCKDVFVFNYGCLVLWGIEDEDDSLLIKSLSAFEKNPLREPIQDSCKYSVSQTSAPSMKEDLIRLSSSDPLEKLAFSYGLSQSTKLIEFENVLETTILRTEKVPKDLAEKGRIYLSRRQIAKETGKIFIVRNSINLHSEILDTPDFFWDHPKLEPLYKMSIQDLEVKPRVELLNKRLEMIQELYAILTTESQHRHSSFLEWVIILLITVEVIIALSRDILGVLHH